MPMNAHDIERMVAEVHELPVFDGEHHRALGSGLPDVAALQGGLDAWRMAGFATEMGLPQRQP